MEDQIKLISLKATLPETKSSPLKMDGWKMTVSFWNGLNFRGEKVSFGEATSTMPLRMWRSNQLDIHLGVDSTKCYICLHLRYMNTWILWI